LGGSFLRTDGKAPGSLSFRFSIVNQSNSFGLRGEVKLLHLQRRDQGGTPALTFRAADAFRFANHVDVAGSEQLHDALVEAEVLYRILNFAVLDIPDIPSRVRPVCNAVRGSTPRILPEATEQQATVHRFDHVAD
jgi:hypothetical protein